MVNTSPTDYKKLFLQAEEQRKQAEEGTKQAEEGAKQAEEAANQAEERVKQLRERSRRTTFAELLRSCHNLLSRPLRIETSSHSTTGSIPPPIGKYCPTRLALWIDCSARQQKIYSSVCDYLKPTEEAQAQFFTPLAVLEWDARRPGLYPMSNERGLKSYEERAVEDHVRDIIPELSKIAAARDEFGLGDKIWSDNHTTSFNPPAEANATQSSGIHQPRLNQFCIHRVDGETDTLLTAGEYKPQQKLPVEALRVELREMDLWKYMARSTNTTDDAEKSKYNAERLVYYAIVERYNVMIQDGLEYSYITNGVARVLLRIPYDDPSTLYYFLCDPNGEPSPLDSETSIARVLCLWLMAFDSTVRDQEWRNAACSGLPLWTSSSDNQPSSPRVEPLTVDHQVPKRSQSSYAPSDIRPRTQSPESSHSSSNQATGHERDFGQIPCSPPTQRAARQRETEEDQGGPSTRHNTQFCTQRCLLGLQTGDVLDDGCPNVKLHRRGQDLINHGITSGDLLRSLKAQLDDNIDRCISLGYCGAHGALFKLICAKYGYVVIGKGTASELWKEVSREAQVYQVLRKSQASAVPVFLGTIDLAKIYFLHGAGEIRHLLVMGWGGDNTAQMELTSELNEQMNISYKEIAALGIVHDDPRFENILWNEELGRALFIDFHRATLTYRRRRPAEKRQRAKRQLLRTEPGDAKRFRVP